MNDQKQFYTTGDIAEILSLSQQRIKQLAVDMEVGTKVGRDWVFTADDLKRLKDRPDRRFVHGLRSKYRDKTGTE
jgi:hypothetical protein